MAARDDILRSLRAKRVPPTALPASAIKGTVYVNRRNQFAQAVEAVAGRCVFVRDDADLSREIEILSENLEAKKIVCGIAGLRLGNVELSGVCNPHELEDVDLAILPGRFGVAENGAVWVDDEGVGQRAVYFISQHLALVISAEQIVDNIHQAYERLAFVKPGFGCFISGPSKTADIEQALVIGAQGPRSLTVYCVGDQSGRA